MPNTSRRKPHQPHQPRHPHHAQTDAPDDIEPDSLPVEPDMGPTPTHIPDDPELDRVVNPEN